MFFNTLVILVITDVVQCPENNEILGQRIRLILLLPSTSVPFHDFADRVSKNFQKYSNSNHWSTEIELYQTLFHWRLNIQRTMEFHLIISFHYVDNRICLSMDSLLKGGPNIYLKYSIFTIIWCDIDYHCIIPSKCCNVIWH